MQNDIAITFVTAFHKRLLASDRGKTTYVAFSNNYYSQRTE